MRSFISKKVLVGIASVALISSTAVAAATTAGATSEVCKTGTANFGRIHKNVPLAYCRTYARAPLHATAGAEGAPSNTSATVDYMNTGRSYYGCWVKGAENPAMGSKGQHKNNIWLYTIGDVNGAVGYQPATHIREGNNYEAPGNVPNCKDWAPGTSGVAPPKSATGTPKTPNVPPPAPGNKAPVGHLDEIEVLQGAVRIRGWAIDPDDPAKALKIQVIYSGTDTDPTSTFALISRPDVKVVYPLSTDMQGFEGTYYQASIVPGTTKACVYANDLTGGQNTRLGCS